MKKFWEKNELLCAILSIVIYVVVMSTVRGNYGDDNLVSVIALLLMAGLLTAFIFLNGLKDYYGFKKPAAVKACLYFIPFVLLCTVNFWFGVRAHFGMPGQVWAVITLALAGYVEEVIFRGLLYRTVEKKNLTRAIIISAVTFGAGHIVNLLTGHGSLETVLQLIYAVAIGFSFALVLWRGGSLLPCIITHCIINIGSVISNNALAESTARVYDYCSTAFIVLVAGLYSLYLWKGKPFRKE